MRDERGSQRKYRTWRLRQEFPYNDVESLLELIVDVLNSTASTIQIGGEVLPVDTVRQRFRQLDSEYISIEWASKRLNLFFGQENFIRELNWIHQGDSFRSMFSGFMSGGKYRPGSRNVSPSAGRTGVCTPMGPTAGTRSGPVYGTRETARKNSAGHRCARRSFSINRTSFCSCGRPQTFCGA